jgi:hypothetical protein
MDLLSTLPRERTEARRLFAIGPRGIDRWGAGLLQDSVAGELLEAVESSDFRDVRGLFSAVADHELELYPFTFRQGAEAITLNGRVVDEDVVPSLELNEPVTFRLVEPLDGA